MLTTKVSVAQVSVFIQRFQWLDGIVVNPLQLLQHNIRDFLDGSLLLFIFLVQFQQLINMITRPQIFRYHYFSDQVFLGSRFFFLALFCFFRVFSILLTSYFFFFFFANFSSSTRFWFLSFLLLWFCLFYGFSFLIRGYGLSFPLFFSSFFRFLLLCRFCSLFRRLSFFFSSFYLIFDTFALAFFILFLRFVLARLSLRGLTFLFGFAIPLFFLLFLGSSFLRLFFPFVFDFLFLFVRLYLLGFGFFVGFLLVDFRFFGRFSFGLGFVGFSIVNLRLFLRFSFILSNFYIGFIGIFLFGSFLGISLRFFLGFSFVCLRSFARFLLLRLFNLFLVGVCSMLFRLLGRFFFFFLGSFIYFSRFLFFLACEIITTLA